MRDVSTGYRPAKEGIAKLGLTGILSVGRQVEQRAV
jgi:hypothetical protein